MNDSLIMLRDLANRFAADRTATRGATDESVGGSALWSELAAIGLLAAPFAEEDGGLGLDSEASMIVMEAFGRTLLSAPFVSTSVIGARLFSETADRSKLQSIASGEMRLALAHEESAFEHGTGTISLRAAQGDGGFKLTGRKILVRDAPCATHLIVSARGPDREETLLLLVPADTEGTELTPYRTIDGGVAADVAFEQAYVGAAALLSRGKDSPTLIRRLLDEATVALCAEAIGVMRTMLDQTASYVKQREQFGRPLSSFQVLQHRLVDMLMEIEAAESLTLRAVLAHGNSVAVSAAKIRVNEALGKVSHEAVQMHGGIGTTQELALSRFFRRAMAIQRECGTTVQHQRRIEESLLAELRGAPLEQGPTHRSAARPICADPESTFRHEVREFLDRALTSELRAEAERQVSVFASPELAAKWHQILYRKGWVAPGWPVQYGGTGWNALQRFIFEEECARVNTPVLPAMGLQMCGPVLIGHGSPAQREFFLPRILSGEHFWCQGYSEPSAGSDLAQLKTRAARDGEDYVLNGTKIWTTYAHAANWIFMLVRTAIGTKPQAGISFLLVPLDTPGISITPIKSISGEHEVNQLFFDGVRVPVANRVGGENQGWAVAKYLLEFERGGGIATNRARRVTGLLKRLATRELALDPDLLRRLAQLEIEIEATEWIQRRMLRDVGGGESVGNANASILKLKASELYQTASLLFLDALGGWGLAEQRDALDGKGPVHGPEYAITGAARYMNSRAMSIFGGSSEIQRGIIAKTVFGL
jgi:alkylation response protein AidB-like acyl-CoA dehydrogenase